MAKWKNRTAVQAPRNGTTSHVIDFTPATEGSLLVLVMEGPVTHTIPAGWTRQGQALNNTELSVYTKTATAGESSFSTTHNGSNYPIGAVVWEFHAGSTWVGAVSAIGLDGFAANPALTGLTGTNVVMAAVAVGKTTANPNIAATWSAPTLDDTYQDVLYNVTDGYLLYVGYVEGYVDASYAPTGTIDPNGKEALTWAVNAYAPPATPEVNAGVDKTAEPWGKVSLRAIATDPDGTIASYAWTQTDGPAVALAGATTDRPSFPAPGTIAGTVLTFSVTVTDNSGMTKADTVAVTILPVTERAVIGGIEVPMQIR